MANFFFLLHLRRTTGAHIPNGPHEGRRGCGFIRFPPPHNVRPGVDVAQAVCSLAELRALVQFQEAGLYARRIFRSELDVARPV